MNRIQKVTGRVLRLEQVRSMGVIGDPGCEGLGAYPMKVYAGALEETARDAITLIAGDLVPAGTAHYYQLICELTETLAQNPVYSLRGNHDTGAYAEYFGQKNYALLADGFTVVVLDNANRTFEAEGLELLSEVLAREDVRQAVIAFHIPVPNHFIQNSVSDEEAARLREAYRPWRSKVKYLLCGHVHSRFVDEVDGIPLLCTGGGGAMIEDVSDEIRACDVEHHVIHFFMAGNELHYRFSDLPEDCYRCERSDAILNQKLQDTVQGELMAHFKYLMFADRAERRGFAQIANLFRALAASEYYHAKNFYAILDQPKPFRSSAETFVPGELFEYEHLYPMLAAYAHAHAFPLAEQAYTAAARAEKEHAALLKQAADVDRFSEGTLYVCPICGHLMTGDPPPDRCPICGGPARQFETYATP